MRFSVAVVATVRRPADLSAGIVAAFVHQVELESPTEEQRLTMLVGLSRDVALGRDVNLERLSKLTAVRKPARASHRSNNQEESQIIATPGYVFNCPCGSSPSGFRVGGPVRSAG